MMVKRGKPYLKNSIDVLHQKCREVALKAENDNRRQGPTTKTIIRFFFIKEKFKNYKKNVGDINFLTKTLMDKNSIYITHKILGFHVQL